MLKRGIRLQINRFRLIFPFQPYFTLQKIIREILHNAISNIYI